MNLRVLLLWFPALLLACPAFGESFMLKVGAMPVTNAVELMAKPKLKLYLDYDVNALGLSDGDAVATLTDQGVFAHHAKAPAANNRPYWTNNASEINGKGYLFFDGVDDLLVTNGSFAVSTPYHVFMVLALSNYAGKAATVFKGAVSLTGSGNTFFLAYSNLVFANGQSMVIRGNGYTNWMVIDYEVNGLYSYVRSNGALIACGPQATGAFSGFQFSNPTYPIAMKMARTLLYTNALSDSEALREQQLLGLEYGIITYARDPLPTWNPTTNVSSTLAVYDLSLKSTTNLTPLATISDRGPYGFNLITTNSPLFVSDWQTNFGLGHVEFNRNGQADEMAGVLFGATYPQPTTTIVVIYGDAGNNSTPRYVMDNCNAPGVNTLPQGLLWNTPPGLYMNAASTVGNGALDSLQANYILEFYANGAGSYVRTNNVAAITGNAGANGRNGFAIAGSRAWDLSRETPVNFYFGGIYTNTLTATERSNVYYYLGNRFNIPVSTYAP